MVTLITKAPTLVAHRGYSAKYPENTLLAYKAAYKHGARFMELDLQMTGDLVPVLHHDKTLSRMAGVREDVRDITTKQFKSLSASYSKRFGDEFVNNRFTTFRRFCNWLKQHSEVTVFVEIKQESIDRVGIPTFLDATYRRIKKAGVEKQCVMISFNHEVVEHTRKISPMRTGWVLPKWSKQNRALLDELNPDFLFCDKSYLPKNDEKLWRGDWQWAIYNLDTVESAIKMANRGFTFLETNEIGTLMLDPALAQSS